jgi:hypothetical protein
VRYDLYNLLSSALLAACFMLIYRLVYSSTLKVKAIYFSKMSTDSHWASRSNIPQDRTLYKFDILYKLNIIQYYAYISTYILYTCIYIHTHWTKIASNQSE